jgi:hypothetical protein
MDRAAVVQLTKGHILLYRQTNIHTNRFVLGGILRAQAFIFAMLTMLNVAGAVPWDAWNARKEKRQARKVNLGKTAA